MSSKFFGNKLAPNTKAEKGKIKSKGRNTVKQVIKKAGRGK